MSVVILGGNERMVRNYKDLCKEYKCDAKIFTEMTTSLRKQIGNPDLLVLFTSTMSHKMVRVALDEVDGREVKIARSHTSSMAALRRILAENVA
ncbi:MAG: DUF2325 domain-containing protein [Lachnospira sp.]|nr:DUF2325 domain-containing protein [Lachnospira sp.]